MTLAILSGSAFNFPKPICNFPSIFQHRLRTTSKYKAATLSLYNTGTAPEGEVSSTAAAQGALHMEGAPSTASALCPALAAELVPTTFLLQGPGSHNTSVPLFCCFSRLWWFCCFPGEVSARTIAPALNPTPTQPQRQPESLGANTWAGQRRGSGCTVQSSHT